MLSYQHSYHAGNHADVLKHIILGEVVAGMQKKETPIFLLDAFASRGIYDLNSPEAQKNREFETGIARLWALRNDPHPLGVARWFKLIEQKNSDGDFSHLPGSTALLAAMMRPQDRLAACDLHPQEFEGLQASFKSSRNLALHKRDAFEAMKALLPPKEKRGMVFLDPSYEEKGEYRKLATAVAKVYSRFAGGVYVVWYPLLPAANHNELFAVLRRAGIRKILRIELDCHGAFPQMQMQGSGMLIVNPPWAAEDAMKASLHWINTHLLSGKGKTHFGWLVPE
ncbi:23S rRNA (adenine2030-N6)-methyltransferase [Mariprofundus ferrinatatus]|uniref:Ribosomal RNA large subunit methyltransferase J n=1 Tax=Mariprofundus ferrinatatus TaxID=1921087 RepID=A0A2K8L1W0_9PROT|nr:23S rRNA (adenine(2030)-N(6))-methyltransferase RlmJ [Mariprofundus ferrinatatus]ATX81305.1 23S rRNA (adenine2030-N6)-methyltransferase [Mariprofundus ferrinatatus]